jgi:hypothetical protein
LWHALNQFQRFGCCHHLYGRGRRANSADDNSDSYFRYGQYAIEFCDDLDRFRWQPKWLDFYGILRQRFESVLEWRAFIV